MQIGAVFPQIEIGADPGPVRAWAEAAEELGYDYVLAYDHVLGADISNRPNWPGPYNHTHLFHEPFVLFGFMAGFTKRIAFSTGIIILPQRQTALVAKQAAEVDVLSGGRLRLGVGIGWNPVEFESLGQDFHTRGKRIEEQVELLRRLWTEDLVTFEGKWDRIEDAGLNPLPVQRPIPIWFGGHAEPVLQRCARMGDGWIPVRVTPEKAAPMIERLRNYARQYGRDPAEIGIESWIVVGQDGPDEWAARARAWKDLNATHLSVNTMNSGLQGIDAHIDRMRKFREAMRRV